MRCLFAILALHICGALAGLMSIDMMIKRAPQGTSGTYTCPDGGKRKAELKEVGANAKGMDESKLLRRGR